MMLTASTTAKGHSPRVSAPQAMDVAVRPAEQAVSMRVHGPYRPSAKERRPDAIESDEPVAA